MLIHIPVGQALNAWTALQKMSTAVYPAKQAFILAKNIARLNGIADIPACESARQAAIRRTGVTDAQGNITVPPDRLEAFAAEFQPVAMVEIEIHITPIPLAVLEHAPDMAPSDMMALELFWEA